MPMSYIFREHIKQSLAVIAFLITLTACTSESYDAGDGPNSYLTADLVLLHTSQGYFVPQTTPWKTGAFPHPE